MAAENLTLLAIEDLTLRGPRRGGSGATGAGRARGLWRAATTGFPIAGALGCEGPGGRWVDRLGEFGVAPHPVAVTADVDDVATVEQTVQQGGGHDLVVQDLAPALEALVRCEHRRGVLVAPVDELEEEDGAAAADGQVADLVDD